MSIEEVRAMLKLIENADCKQIKLKLLSDMGDFIIKDLEGIIVQAQCEIGKIKLSLQELEDLSK